MAITSKRLKLEILKFRTWMRNVKNKLGANFGSNWSRDAGF